MKPVTFYHKTKVVLHSHANMH